MAQGSLKWFNAANGPEGQKVSFQSEQGGLQAKSVRAV